MKTNVLDGPGRPRAVSSDKFKVGSIHQGTVGKYFFGRRIWDPQLLGVFVNFGGPRPGIIFDHGKLGLLTGETVGVKIVSITGIGATTKYDLELVNRVPGSEAKAQPTDIGPYMIVPRSVLPCPTNGPEAAFDALIPKPLAVFSVSDKAPAQERELVEKGATVTCPINNKQYQFFAPEAIWQTAKALANGEKVAVTIGQYDPRLRHPAIHPAVPGYAMASINIPNYIIAKAGETWEVYLKDHPQSNFETVARQIAEGTLVLSIVPKPRKGFVYVPSLEQDFLQRPRVRFSREEYRDLTYHLPEYFAQHYKDGDEIEFVLIGEIPCPPGAFPNFIACPVREREQLEQLVESLRQGAEVKIGKIDYRSDLLLSATIGAGDFIFRSHIYQRDQADESLKSLVEGKTVRLALSRNYKEMSFSGNELFWMSHFNRYSSNFFKLAIAD